MFPRSRRIQEVIQSTYHEKEGFGIITPLPTLPPPADRSANQHTHSTQSFIKMRSNPRISAISDDSTSSVCDLTVVNYLVCVVLNKSFVQVADTVLQRVIPPDPHRHVSLFSSAVFHQKYSETKTFLPTEFDFESLLFSLL